MCVFENRMSTIQLQDLTMAVSNPEMCPQRDTYSLAVGTRMNSLVIRLSARGPLSLPHFNQGSLSALGGSRSRIILCPPNQKFVSLSSRGA